MNSVMKYLAVVQKFQDGILRAMLGVSALNVGSLHQCTFRSALVPYCGTEGRARESKEDRTREGKQENECWNEWMNKWVRVSN